MATQRREDADGEKLLVLTGAAARRRGARQRRGRPGYPEQLARWRAPRPATSSTPFYLQALNFVRLLAVGDWVLLGRSRVIGAGQSLTLRQRLCSPT